MLLKGMSMQRIAINGFGRIGRNVLRAWFENPKDFNFDIVAINDVADVETLLHLFKYDSTHGRFPGQVDLTYEDEYAYLHVTYRDAYQKVQVLGAKTFKLAFIRKVAAIQLAHNLRQIYNP